MPPRRSTMARQPRSQTAGRDAWVRGRPITTARSRSPGAASCWFWARSRRSQTGRCPAPAGRPSTRNPWPHVARSRPSSPDVAHTLSQLSSPVRARGRTTRRCVRPSRVFERCSVATRPCRACSRRAQATSISADRSTAVVVGLAGATPAGMVKAAGQAQDPPRATVGAWSRGPAHGTRRDVVGLQRGQQGGDAQVRDAVLAADARAAAVRLRHAWSRQACRCCSRWPACSARAGCCSSPDSSPTSRSGR